LFLDGDMSKKIILLFLTSLSFLCLSITAHDSIKPMPSNMKRFINNPIIYFSPNFHVVEENKCYRCKQLKPEQLAFYIQKYGIKTIINLRGVNEDQEWWIKENKVAIQNNVTLVNIPFSASELPPKENLRKLFEALDNKQGPFVLHCLAGADRTGLAATIYAYEYMGLSLKNSLKQLSVRFGHISELHPNMKNFMQKWAELRKNKTRAEALDAYNPDTIEKKSAKTEIAKTVAKVIAAPGVITPIQNPTPKKVVKKIAMKMFCPGMF